MSATSAWPSRIDLGLDGGLTETGAILGTPSYMAPEQAASRRGPIGPPTDVYGLGAILYQMLTGRPPFQGASPLDTILLVLEQDPVPPRVLNPKADPDLEMVALKCLQKSPEHRYPTAGALADDLDAYLDGKLVSARSTRFRDLAGRYLGETPHAALLENWGALWMYHGVALIVFYGLTYALMSRGVTARWPYFAIFTVGLGAWAALFWQLRRRLGPVTFVERQLAHIWGAGVVGLNLILAAEWLLGLPVMDAGTVAGDHQRDALPGQGGHPLGRVLRLRRGGVPHPDPRARSIPRWPSRSSPWPRRDASS